jgi:hypothetical protein
MTREVYVIRLSRAALLISFISILTHVLPATSQDTASRIKSEIERLQKSLKDKPISDPNFAQVGSMVSSALDASRHAADARQFYVSLESLGQAEDLLSGVRVIADKGASVKNNFAAFDSEWGAASLRLTALDKEAHDRKWENAPAAIRALAEAAQGKAIPLLDGARGFATANGPSDGLFYMGQAEGEAEFARFCATLSFPAPKGEFPLRSLLPELQALQTKTNAAFQPPKSIDLHARFIALNSTIKLAEEFDSTRFYAGALYQYLEAVRHYGMLGQPPLDAAKQSQLKEDLAAAVKKLAASPNDDSIGQLFLERAESQTAHRDGSTPSADEWRNAQVILDHVLPAYEAARKLPRPLQRASGKTVDVTLVRWPYT